MPRGWWQGGTEGLRLADVRRVGHPRRSAQEERMDSNPRKQAQIRPGSRNSRLPFVWTPTNEVGWAHNYGAKEKTKEGRNDRQGDKMPDLARPRSSSKQLHRMEER